MTVRVRGGGRALGLALLVTAGSACAPLGGMLPGGSGWPGSDRTVLDGEVRSVDGRRDVLRVVARQGGTRTLRWHRDTRVRYGRRDYPVTTLERGDLVRVWVTYDRGGDPWADRIEVLAGRDDRGGRNGRTVRLDGIVLGVDPRRGRFTVEPRRGESVVVYVPARPDRDDLRHLERLRRGDRVRLDVRPAGRREAELVRFR